MLFNTEILESWERDVSYAGKDTWLDREIAPLLKIPLQKKVFGLDFATNNKDEKKVQNHLNK